MYFYKLLYQSNQAFDGNSFDYQFTLGYHAARELHNPTATFFHIDLNYGGFMTTYSGNNCNKFHTVFIEFVSLSTKNLRVFLYLAGCDTFIKATVSQDCLFFYFLQFQPIWTCYSPAEVCSVSFDFTEIFAYA